jgi:hypothetical protein
MHKEIVMPNKLKYKPKKVKSPILEDAKKRGYGPGGPQTPGAKKKKKVMRKKK